MSPGFIGSDWKRALHSGQDIAYDMPVNIGQPEIATLGAEREPLVIEAEQV